MESTAQPIARGRLSSWANGLLRAFRDASLKLQLYWAALAIVLVLGTVLRLNGYLGQPISFWLDEALWAPRFLNKPLLSLGIRPLGFVWLTRNLVEHFGATERWFRFLPNFGGVVSLWLMPYVASRLLESRALRLLFVLLFAVHPGLIDLAKEFKPYSFEVLVHVLLVVLYLRYEHTRKLGYFYALLAYLPVSFLLAYNAAFTFPGLLLLASWNALKQRRAGPIVAVLLSGVVCAAVVLSVHHFALSTVEKKGRTEAYWGQKYDLFYPGALKRDLLSSRKAKQAAEQSRLSWTLEKTADMAAVIGLRRELWNNRGQLPERLASGMYSTDRWLWIGLAAVGAFAVLRKRREQALVWLAPLVVLGILNALGKWPLGQFRTNLFTCVYLFPLPMLGIALLGSLGRHVWVAVTAAVLLISVLPGFAFGFDLHGHKRIWCQDGYGRELITALYELRQKELAAQPAARRARLVLDLYSYKVCNFYLTFHPDFMLKYRDFDEHFAREEVGSKRLVKRLKERLKGRSLVYAVAAKAASAQDLKDFVKSGVRVVNEVHITDTVLIMVLDN